MSVDPSIQKSQTNFEYCFICQKSSSVKVKVQKPSLVSVANILTCARKRHQFNDNVSLVNDLIDRIDYHSAETISQNNGFYHREIVG